MKGLREKFRKNGGFTLVEMLIVVAIIAILIAVSIPLVSNSLERTRHATDAANERAAKAEIMICYLADGTTPVTKNTPYFYNAAKGSIETGVAGINGYGQHKTNKGKYIAVTINDDDEVVMAWVDTAVTGVTAGDLCSAAKDANH